MIYGKIFLYTVRVCRILSQKQELIQKSGMCSKPSGRIRISEHDCVFRKLSMLLHLIKESNCGSSHCAVNALLE